MPKKATPPHFWILQGVTAALFAGRAWQHLRWDGPYRTLLWDESLMKPFVQRLLATDWATYVTDPGTDAFVRHLTTGLGWFFVVVTLITFLATRFSWARWVVGIGSAWLLVIAMLYTKEHFQQAGLFVESSLMWATPLLFLGAIGHDRWLRRWVWLAALACSLTFMGHGAYALGWHPRPGHFVQMTLSITGWSESACHTFLRIAGILDMIVAIGLLIPMYRVRSVAALYMTGWGLATAVARIWAHFIPAFWQNSLAQWLHEVVIRLPHALIPLLLYLIWRRARKTKEPELLERERRRFY